MKLAHGQIEWANLRAKTPRRRKLAHFPDFASPNFFSDSCPVRQRRLGLRRRWRGLQRARLTRARYRRNLWTFQTLRTTTSRSTALHPTRRRVLARTRKRHRHSTRCVVPSADATSGAQKAVHPYCAESTLAMSTCRVVVS